MSGGEPLVSAIIPTYKRDRKLEQAIRTIKSQTYDNIEIIVVDDYPGSQLEKEIKTWGVDKYICHQENQGVSKSRNDGIDVSEGRFIAFLDDDDLWNEEKIQKQVSLSRKVDDSFGLIYTGIRTVTGNNKGKTVIPHVQGESYQQLLTRNFLSTPSVMVKRECFDQVGLFNTGLDFAEDWDMWLRIAEEYKIGGIQEPLVSVRMEDEDRASLNWEKRYSSMKHILHSYEDDLRNYPPAAGRRHRLFAVACAETGRYNESIEHLILSLHYAKNPLALMYLVIIFVNTNILHNVLQLRSKVITSGFKDGLIKWWKDL